MFEPDARPYYNKGRDVCQSKFLPPSIAICENTATAKKIATALNVNADLLAALEALEAIGPKQKPPKIMEGGIAARNWKLFEQARAAIAKAKSVKE